MKSLRETKRLTSILAESSVRGLKLSSDPCRRSNLPGSVDAFSSTDGYHRMPIPFPNRRRFLQATSAVSAAAALPCLNTHQETLLGDEPPKFQFNYLVASCMYGYTDLAVLLPEVRKVGATAIDVWPMVHGNQREQIETMGEDAFVDLLHKNHVKLGCISQYKLGPFGLDQEMQFAKRMGCHTIVVNAKGKTKLVGAELKQAIAEFVEQFKPVLDLAGESDIDIAVENHSMNIIATPDSIKWLRELCPHPRLKFALAPYHLEQNPLLINELIRFLQGSIAIFYAWQHGAGAMEKQSKEKELLQLPGKGTLDFQSIVKSLVDTKFNGWTEIFMHSFPRGLAVHDTTDAVTQEINLARKYLESLIPS